MNEYADNWRAAGACLTADPDLFFPVSGGAPSAREEDQALRICARCAVRQQCLDFAVRTGEMHGIWGGTTPAERIRDRRSRTRRRAAAGLAAGPAAGPAWQEPETRAS
jgi:WhiB family redox-sensing transcriptional regulator